jgi:hypothetical protein
VVRAVYDHPAQTAQQHILKRLVVKDRIVDFSGLDAIPFVFAARFVLYLFQPHPALG